jgi:hypothetical protein
MNNAVKIALALAAGSSLLYLGLRKKNKKEKVFLAPDGNTYKENEMYRTYDNKLFKNGKEFHFKTPEPEVHFPKSSTFYGTVNGNTQLKQQTTNNDITYHHKGIRHH